MRIQDKILLQNKQFLTLLSGTGANGVTFYAYIMLVLPKYEQMERDMRQNDSISIFEYGEVVEAGEGETPSDEVKLRMEEAYGFKHSNAGV